ncbi:hypothetical protein J3459_014860 [Metarhizium acridum]|nr:hypothetical protein J3459_014860 [Metarhizium acridum]
MKQTRLLLTFVAGLVSFLLFTRSTTATPAPRQLAKCNRAVQDACQKEDRTYSSEAPKAGSHMPWALIPLREIGFPAKQYITIVNLTPHRFVLDRSRTHSYQMDTFDWDDIPQGRARQNTAEYTKDVGKNPVDDGGEAYYTIQGTNKRFEIRARTHIPDSYPRRTIIDLSGMGLGQREYLDPGKETAVTLVITGSDSYGFTASLRHGRGNWMKGIYDAIKDRRMQHIVMPATHDSGMSRISGKIGSIGTEVNTQTQGLNIYNQLRAGARLFDLRVGSVHKVGSQDSYSFWTMHVNDELAKVVIGNTGESLDDVVNEVNQFTAENPGEVIFFRVRYLNGILDIPTAGPIYWTADIVNNFFSKLKGINNRCGNLDLNTKFNKQKASYFMDQNSGKGCVLFLLNGNLKPDVPQDSVPDGIYKNSMMDVWDHWSNLPDTENMANDQVAGWKTVGRSGDFKNDQFLISQWLVSADAITTTALSIQNIGILPTNPALYWMGVNNMSPESWPTAVLIDYIGVVIADQWSWDQLSAEMYTFAIGMNLYMISENCDIHQKRSPLLPGANSAVQTLDAGQLASAWNGIIYANGTVDNDPAPTLHPGRARVLKKGTEFLNGTFLQNDVENQSF